MTDDNPANTQMSDQDAIRYINERLRSERIRIKERYAFLDGKPIVGMATTHSRQGKYIDIQIEPISPTEEELRRLDLTQKALRSLLPSALMRNRFHVRVYASHDDEMGVAFIKATLIGGLVEEIQTPRNTPFYNRLAVADPLEKVLNVAFEAYRTRYVPR